MSHQQTVFRHRGQVIPPCPKVKVFRTKKTGVIKRALVGGVLLGGVGAIVGGASAGSESQWVEREPTFWETAKWNQAWSEEYDRLNPKPPSRFWKWVKRIVLGYLAFNAVIVVMVLLGVLK